jgi:hypothetical protein
MKDMSQDFEDMKNARIESKRKLEQRFANTYAYVILFPYNCLVIFLLIVSMQYSK